MMARVLCVHGTAWYRVCPTCGPDAEPANDTDEAWTLRVAFQRDLRKLRKDVRELRQDEWPDDPRGDWEC